MSRRRTMRNARRWAGWGERALEARRMMSASPWGVEVASASRRLGASQAMTLTITNTTDVAIRLAVSSVDSYDWDGDDRPDHNLDGVVLQPGQSVVRREEVNRWASRPAFDLAILDDATGDWILRGRVQLTRSRPQPIPLAPAGRGPNGTGAGWSFSTSAANPALRDSSGSFPYRIRNAGGAGADSGTLAFEPASAVTAGRPRPGWMRGPLMGAAQPNRSLGTNLTIKNTTDVAVRLAVSEVDNWDWDGDSRPDHNLEGLVIQPGESITKREETNAWSDKPAFTVSFHDDATGEWILTARATLVGQDVPMPLGRASSGGGLRASYDFEQWRVAVISSNDALKDASGRFPYRIKSTGNTGEYDSGWSFDPAGAALAGAPRPGEGPRATASQASYLTIRNDSSLRIRLGVSAVDSYDWDGDSRPDHNLQGVVLEPGGSTTQREEVNANALAAFDLSLYDDATGERIGTARALFRYPGAPWDASVFYWKLDPTSRDFSHDGGSVTLASRWVDEAGPFRGLFVVS